jgi:hypothetical protein
MVDMTAPYAGDFVRADELPEGQRLQAVIRFAGVEQVGQDQTPKAVLSLARAEDGKPWPRKVILNKTNALILTAAFGRDGAGWINQTITVWREPVQFGGKMVPGIKVAAGNQAPPSSSGAIPLPGPIAPAPGNGTAPSTPGNGAAPGAAPSTPGMDMAGHTVPLPTGMPSAPPGPSKGWNSPGSELDDQIPY